MIIKASLLFALFAFFSIQFSLGCQDNGSTGSCSSNPYIYYGWPGFCSHRGFSDYGRGLGGFAYSPQLFNGVIPQFGYNFPHFPNYYSKPSWCYTTSLYPAPNSCCTMRPNHINTGNSLC